MRRGAETRAPWLDLYDAELPHEIAPEHGDALTMFKAAARRFPARDLIRYFDTPLTLGRIDQSSDALAVGLSDLGLARGDRVGLYLQNVPQFVISVLAAWKLGAIPVPCNPMLRGHELATQLRDCGAVGLVTLESLYREVAAAVVPAVGVGFTVTTSELDLHEGNPPDVLAGASRDRPVDTNDLLELIEAHVGERPDPVDLAPDDVAILTYTSGTTGPAKGAMNTHGNVVFASQAYREWMHLTEDDVILGISPLFHITGLIAHIGLAISASTPLVLAYRFDAAETCRLIELHRATVTVAAITAYLALAREKALDRHDISSLRKAYSGGATIPPAVVEDFRSRTGIIIRSAYGLTETTSPTHLTPLRQRPPTDPSTGALAVGVPIFNTTMRIVDEQGQPLPPGAVGEVTLSGPQVVPGYWGKPEETAYAIRDGELHTGDVGKTDSCGWLYIVDRKKDLIVASGFKVWPREVEDALYQHAAVHEAAVVGAPDGYRGETVHAFVSLREGAQADAEELVCFCRERLAAYKCPREVTFIDEIPKTVSGKVLRRQLRGGVGPPVGSA